MRYGSESDITASNRNTDRDETESHHGPTTDSRPQEHLGQRPATAADHVEVKSGPSGEMQPIPVTTTRRREVAMALTRSALLSSPVALSGS